MMRQLAVVLLAAVFAVFAWRRGVFSRLAGAIQGRSVVR